MKYCESLNIVKQANILEDKDFKTIYNMQDELTDVFLHAQVFRTRTEMEASILNDIKFPTPDSKYWQSVREQNVMFHELVMLSYEYRKNQVGIKKLQRQLEDENDDLECELLQIEIEKKQFIALNQQRTAKDRIREIREWHEIKERLTPEMEYSLKDCNEHQLISYTKRWIYQYYTGNLQGLERQNVVMQMDKGLKLCKERDLLNKVLDGCPEKIKHEIVAMLPNM